jgi:hypothetical protein
VVASSAAMVRKLHRRRFGQVRGRGLEDEG